MEMHRPMERIVDAGAALALLREGNTRYRSGNLTPKDSYKEDRGVMAAGQRPFAVVLTCSDSRVAPEIYFDQRLGDIFVVRNAGNVADATALGSIEYAVSHLKTPLVAVVGHGGCGAVAAACGDDELPPNIKWITDRIKPAVSREKSVEDAILRNVALVAGQIEGDEVIRRAGAKVVAAYYDIATGEVVWL